jgi:hypothetical protein
MYDPFQTYATLGSFYGIPTPIGVPHPALQGAMHAPTPNPQAAFLGLSPLGQPGFAQYPGQALIGSPQLQQLQQLQLASTLAAQAAIPQLLGLSPLAAGFQNQLLAAQLYNPLISAGLNPAALGPNVGQPFGQPFSPYPQFGQIGSSSYGQMGYPLAPQSWIGQSGHFGGGQVFGGAHPLLSQWSQRPFQSSQGLSPWGY